MKINYEQKVYDSQKYYTGFILWIYDLWVVGFNCSFAWMCPSNVMVKHYNKYVSANHLDLGIGTGYYLDKCKFPSEDVKLTIMDMNNSTLDKAEYRLRRYNPQTYLQNALEPIKHDVSKFDSIGINFLMHCIPGHFSEKGVVFTNLKKQLNPNGVLFGSTILNHSIKKNFFGKFFLDWFNKEGVFNNLEDTEEALEKSLRSTFNYYKITIKGSVAMFCASDRKLD